MRVLGKCPPTSRELSEAAQHGFEQIELYLEQHHLDNFDAILERCLAAAVTIDAVHTPIATLSESEYIQQANDLADELEAFLVIHSNYIPLYRTSEIYERVDFTVDHGFENMNGDSIHHIENVLFEDDRNLVLDTAHLYTAEESYVTAIEWLLTERSDLTPHIHFCDSTKLRDGLPFGDGEMDMAAIGRLIKQHFDGRLVLEVMPQHQQAALDAFDAY